MGFFDCCLHCPSTKRHPGCHADCPDYKEQAELWEDAKNKHREESHRLCDHIAHLNRSMWPRNHRKFH